MNIHHQDDLFAPSTLAATSATNVATSVEPGVPTLVDYATRVAKTLWPKDHTRKSNLRACRWFQEFNDHAQLTLETIRRKHIYDFVEHLIEDRGQSPNTANKYQAAISRVLNYANERELVDNPIKLKYAPITSGRPRFFTKAEEEELVQYLRDLDQSWMADMVVLSCATGMRKSEVLAINDPRVELTEDGWLFLPKEVTKEHKDKEVPFNARALAAYNRLMDRAPGVPFRQSITIYSHRTFYRNWAKAQRDVFKGDKTAVFHTCRHTAATRLANDAKINTKLIGDMLGHASQRTTSRYIDAKKSSLRDAVNMI